MQTFDSSYIPFLVIASWFTIAVATLAQFV